MCPPDEACGGLDYICWPTIAPSSIATYTSTTISELDGMVLVTSLKLGGLYAVDVGTGARETELYSSVDRLRRVTVSADGGALYVATDVSGNVMGPDGAPTTTLANPGAILKLTWVEG